jgi:hypothetical protein
LYQCTISVNPGFFLHDRPPLALGPRGSRGIGDQDARSTSKLGPLKLGTPVSDICDYVFSSSLLSVSLYVLSADKLVTCGDYMTALRRALFIEISRKGPRAVF